MNKKTQYAIIGTGAVGAFYGMQLQQAGCDVHFLCHSAYKCIQEKGLQLHWKNKTIALKVNAYASTNDMPSCDVIFICLKTTANHLLKTILPPIIKKDSVIVVLQNGLGNEEAIENWFPNISILCATTNVGAAKTAPNVIACNHFNMTKVAPYFISDESPDALKNFANALIAAQIPVTAYDDYLLLRWQKLLWNIPLNGLSVIHQMDSLTLLEKYRNEIDVIAKEVIEISKAYGREMAPEFYQNMLDFTRTLGAYKTSMLVDFINHRPLELEYFYENPLKAAKGKNIKTPHIENLYQRLKRLS